MKCLTKPEREAEFAQACSLFDKGPRKGRAKQSGRARKIKRPPQNLRFIFYINGTGGVEEIYTGHCV